jgi:uncharacterized protein YdcH (DUF465 family)
MSMTREIRDIQHTLMVQLNQDVTRLHQEKDQLRQEIGNLQGQQKQLQTRQIQGFNRQQLAQQQLWSKQLAQVLASNLQDELSQRFQELAVATERPSIRGAAQGPSLSKGEPPAARAIMPIGCSHLWTTPSTPPSKLCNKNSVAIKVQFPNN